MGGITHVGSDQAPFTENIRELLKQSGGSVESGGKSGGSLRVCRTFPRLSTGVFFLGLANSDTFSFHEGKAWKMCGKRVVLTGSILYRARRALSFNLRHAQLSSNLHFVRHISIITSLRLLSAQLHNL